MNEYAITESISDAPGIALYRGSGAGGRVLLEIVTGRPSPRDLMRFEHELELGSLMPATAVARPLTMTTIDGKVALVCEYFAGRPLSSIVSGPTEIRTFLKIAIGICSALGEIHPLLVHRDLNPDHILVDLDGNVVKLTGFGIASLIQSERQALDPAPLIEGSLAYISPEQTRRTTHPIDSRSDLYSLGVVLYELATGEPPFRGRDLLDWVHAHLARTPAPPHEVVPEIPRVVSDIILKLLAKSPEDRYQTATGLRADLERCLEASATEGGITSFPLATRDVSERFEIPATLFGRQQETAVLRAGLDRAIETGLPVVRLITGPTGAGKTALVGQLYEPVIRARAFFAIGRCERYGQQSPYRPLVQACSSLVTQLLALGDEEKGRWRARLAEAVGLHGRLLTERVPELAQLIGEQPPVVELTVTQAERRFFQVFWRFLSVFSTAEHVLVLFLDDLQWADTASLRLLQHVVADPDTRYMFVVATYRDSELAPATLVPAVLDDLRRRVDVADIALGGLSVDDIDRLLRETLHYPPGDTRSLAALVHERTAGNPFYTREFVSSLYRERLVELDVRTKIWTWNLGQIAAKPATENVADLMVKRLTELPAELLEVLRLAAFLGSRFRSEQLAAISVRPHEVVRRDLFEAVRRGLLVHTGDEYELVHDRVRQQAYALTPEPERPALHRLIGWRLAGSAAPSQLGEEIFDVASHLTRGASAIATAQERVLVAAFDLEAGRRASAAAAHSLAAEHLAAGIALVDDAMWKEAYDVAYSLHLELAQSRYLTAAPDAAERLLAVLFARARTRSQLVALYHMKVDLAWMLDDFETAIDAVVACLRLFGVDLERRPSTASTTVLYERVAAALGDRAIEDLRALPPISDPEVEQLLATISTAFPAAYWYDENLHFCLSSLAARLAIEHGVSASAAHVFADFGMIIGAREGRYLDGSRFGLLAIDLVERPGFERTRARVYMVFGGMTVHWTRPLTDHSYVEAAFTIGNELGDLLHASNSCLLILDDLLSSSARLGLVHERALEFSRYLRKVKYDPILDAVESETRLVESLLGETEDSQRTPAWWRDPAASRTRFGETPLLIARLQAALMFGDVPLAADLALELRVGVRSIRGYWRVADYHFLAALALAARYPEVSGDQQRLYREQLAVHRDRYAAWEMLCPENFRSRHLLIRAEIARLDGDAVGAMQGYEDAIAAARQAHSPSNEAIAFEIAARFYRARRLTLIADTYLREARACYRQWGAEGKVRWLDAHHPQLQESSREPQRAVVAPSARLDLAALAASLFAIASEIDRPRLLSKILHVVMQQAGAERGVLVTGSRDELVADVEAVLAGDELVVRIAPIAADGTAAVPLALIRRAVGLGEAIAISDGEVVISDDADRDYLSAQHPRSVLCVPVIRRGDAVGALYLEHNTLAGAFSPETIRTTQLLASQVAISLENAELYGGLLRENTQRRAAEAALVASRAHLDRVLQHMADAVIACDATGRITLVNSAFETVTGLVPSETEAWSIAQIASTLQLGPPEGGRFPDADLPLRGALAGVPRVDVAATLVRARSGTRAYVRISSAPIRSESGVITGAVSVLHDVTEAAQLEQLKDQFIRVAAHELKTPVAIIRLVAELLSTTAATEPEAMAERAEYLVRGAERIHRIVEAILLMSALQVGRLELAVETIDLANVVATIAGEAARRERRVIRLEVVPALVRADRERLAYAISQLVSNALTYSPGGQDVEVSMTRTERDVVVHVRDHGVGIPAAQQPYIFGRFFRAHTDTAYDFGGMGVGLFLAREIAKRHGGDVWFESTEGAGSTFHLRVPLEVTSNEE